MCEGLFTAWQGRRLLSRQWIHCWSSSNACQYTLLFILLLCPCPGGIKRWCCLTSVTYIWSAGCVCGRPAGWRVLADRAWLGRPGSRLPLCTSIAGLGRGISWRPPAYSLLVMSGRHSVTVTPVLALLYHLLRFTNCHIYITFFTLLQKKSCHTDWHISTLEWGSTWCWKASFLAYFSLWKFDVTNQ